MCKRPGSVACRIEYMYKCMHYKGTCSCTCCGTVDGDMHYNDFLGSIGKESIVCQSRMYHSAVWPSVPKQDSYGLINL